jgi:hypothetical protein
LWVLVQLVADREAAARREEAEAYYEHQRARAAAAAADFEATLGERRDKAAAEFQARMNAHEQALAQAQERATALSAESEKAHAAAQAESRKLLESARAEAEALVAEARDKAERIRRDSERELAAATARRDSITAQLSNVRQMLATLGGASMVESLVEDGRPEDAGSEQQPKDATSPEDQQQPVKGDKGGQARSEKGQPEPKGAKTPPQGAQQQGQKQPSRA